MKNQISNTLEELLKYFPKLDPPMTLSGEVIHTFSTRNKAIPAQLIDKLFRKWESMDEYSEIIPCFRLESSGEHFIIVYWKGGLLTYEYVLMTLNKKAGVIAKKVIAGTLSNNRTIKESVAVINKELQIFSVAGETDINKSAYNPENSASFCFEIMPDGSIGSTKEDNETWEEKERKN
ncbi:MAG: hypothetical protein EBS24_06630 [Chitinophagia bacterium]|jgi:hypothetical protein|nr:hypothetical protein [Chitinophagia bacterium]